MLPQGILKVFWLNLIQSLQSTLSRLVVLPLMSVDNLFSSWNHVYQEANQVTDHFASHDLGLDDLVVFDWVPSFASLKVLADVSRVSFPHGF